MNVKLIFDKINLSEKKTLIISSDGVVKRLNFESVKNQNFLVFSNVPPNPKYNEIVNCLDYIKDIKIDLILAIGGGTVIDFSKLISVFKSIPISQIKNSITNNTTYSRDCDLIFVPTLFGSGAEQTPFAVCYLDNIKYSVSSKDFYPDKVFYFTDLALTIPPKIKLANILDCFCQACESITSKNSNSKSISYSTKAIENCILYAEEYIKNSTPKSISKIAEASKNSGKAIAITKTTAPHALSYFLTTYHFIPHGYAVGLMFIFFIDIYIKKYKNNKKINGTMTTFN